MSTRRAPSRFALLFTLAPALAGCPDDPAAPVPPPPDAGTSLAELHDPLSIPETPAWSTSEFSSAATCAGCHPDHYAEWRASTHAYAMKDPLFRALVGVRSQDFAGKRDPFCTQCHSAIGTRGGECVESFSFEALSPVVLEGVTCEACHKVTSLERHFNSGHRIDPAGPIHGPISDPMPTPAHASQPSVLFSSSDLCGGCHDVVEFTALPLERPYQEWLESPARADGKTCQSCHMRGKTGPAAAGGPIRTTHEHRWVGVDYPLRDGVIEDDERDALKGRIAELLRGTAKLEVALPARVRRGGQLDVVVTVTNQIDAHNLPTGSTFNRQVWVELTLRDATGAVFYRTGDLDANGDLRDHWSALDAYGDHDLIRFGSRFVDARNNPTLFPWRAAEHFSTTLSPGYAHTETLFVRTASAAPGTAELEARVLFRSVAPFLLRALGLGDEVPALETFEITSTHATVTLE